MMALDSRVEIASWLIALHGNMGCDTTSSFDTSGTGMTEPITTTTATLEQVTSHVNMRSGISGLGLTATGLHIDRDDISKEEYNQLFRTVLDMHRSCNWLLGDTLILAESRWGNAAAKSKYEDAAQATGLSIPSLMNIVMTCRAFPIENRNPELSFTHHLEAACTKLSSEQRKGALSQAATKKLNCADFRRALRAEVQASQTEEERREKTGENDDKPFGVLELPTPQEAEEALPIAYELSKAACWLEENPAHTLTEKHRSALIERLLPIIRYAHDLDIA